MRLAVSFVLLFGFVLAARGQTQEEAMEHLSHERWDEAAAAFEALAAQAPEEPRTWYYLGLANHQRGRYAAAVAAWERALKAGFAPINTHYNLASAHARNGDPDRALGHLRSAVAAGYFDVQHLASDEDLASLRALPAFADLVAQAERNAQPCLYDETRRAFDFWVGTWEVRDAQGQFQGRNRIEKREKGCVLVEEWEGASGGSGMSMNFYDTGIGRWVQVWMGAFGSVIRLEGGLDASGAMVLEGTTTTRTPGETRPFRGTWTLLDDGRVRQRFEQYDEASDSWRTWFDGFYSRVEGETRE